MSRKIYCLLLAFVLVLSVSCVAASDANQTADTLTQADETDGIQKVTYENTISNESTSETNGEQYTMDLKSNIDDYGTLTANVTVNESVKGNITFSINYTGNEIYNQTVAIENGSASFSGYATNASGTYIVTATYTGDANLTSKTINKILMITRNSPDLEIVSKIINDMGNIQVNITLNRNATGNITLAFNDTKKIIEIVNGTAILENYILEKGNYTMQAYYDGDRDYFKAVKNDTLKVEKSTTELRIDSLVSETGMMDIEAFINENATGNITITITNANGTTIQTTQQTTINGTVILDPIFVENNTYTINATYTGDNNYYKATNTTNIEITKKQTNIIITSVKVDDLGNINVIIKIDENATGNITLTFNDTEETLEIINGTATLENYRLAKGNYTITATYPENENYFKGNANEIININKNTTELTINILVSETGMMDITAYINENATGNITITITNANGTTIQTTQQTTINGTVIPDPIFVENNTYTINATYTGDNNYYKATNSINIEITKKQAKLNITSVKVDDLGNISVNITIDENATGNITLAFNDNEVTIPIANGTATLKNYRLAKGNYTITATYPENENYFKAIANETLDVKHTPELSINVESDEYGVQTVTLTIDENATGNITLYIIGNTSILDFEKAIENGTVIFNNITLEKDNYTFIAEYEGDDNYYKANATDTFNVTKSVPTLESIATVYDNVIVVNTNITNTTTGNVTYRFLLNGTEVRKVSIAINGTDASYIDTQIFQKGNYTVIIEYPGDENYYKTNTTLNATIAKNTPKITINITTDEYGTTISANSTAPGNITIDVFDSTSQVIISENNTYIGQFQKGNYTIMATYEENDEYFSAAEFNEFEIAKSIANITANSTVTDNIIVIKTEITNTTTGNVTYTFLINGTVIKQATVAINGTDASYTDKILQKGNYTILIEYAGDENYYKTNTTLNATIAKNTPKITINITTDEYGTETSHWNCSTLP
ncbi:Ig-like domain-containing protein [uncultured Methanobrevibacter sp.]|uniref:Ig-like domain-containing protein n=1 Tax=uncultured Methanobrevibacter sp. TaxID=253161 RepID=UPI0025F70FED|nr:Ig-like domain-containing protein [uncultured Methanobrevibacter sp.]